MLFRLALRLNPQRIVLEITGQFGDFFGNGCRKHQGAAFSRGCVQNVFQIFAEPQIKHFVRFVQNSGAQARQIKRAAVDMIAQPARSADNNMRATVQRALFGAVIHTAHTCGNLRTGGAVKPIQLACDLQRQFAGWRDYQSHWRISVKQFIRTAQQLIRNRYAKGHGFT